MSDIFSLKLIPMTSEIGMVLKNLRITHEVTAKSVVTKFSKSSSYITKLEKGDIKKVESDFFIELCNFITKSNDGLSIFLSTVARNYSEYTNDTKIILKNIDNLLIEHYVSTVFVTEINKYIIEKNINIDNLVEQINKNEDLEGIFEHTILTNLPENRLFTVCGNDGVFIKFNIPSSYVYDLINNKIQNIHYVVAEGILYNLYKLGCEKEPQNLANNKLKIYNIYHYIRSNYIEINDENIDKLFGDLQPDISKTLQDVTYAFKIIINLTKQYDYSGKRIKQIDANLKSDLSFAYAYMSTNLEKLSNKSTEKKQQFLTQLKQLIDEYSQDEKEFMFYE